MHAFNIEEKIEKEFLVEELKSISRAKDLLPYLQRLPTIEVAEILMELPEDILLQVFEIFPYNQQAYIFADFNFETQKFLFENLDKRAFALMFENVDSAKRADFYQNLDKEEQVLLLPYLDKQTLENLIHLSSYPPETAGGIMSSEFATIYYDITVKEALEIIKKDSPRKMIYYCYAVDENMHLHGFLTLKDLITAEPDTLISEILQTEFTYALVDEDRESVAQKIEKYDLVAIPVLNHQGQLVGIVRHDSAMEIIREEQTEDMEKFMGIFSTRDEFDYLETSPFKQYKKRIAWIATLSILGIISGIIIHSFENALEKMIILALYMPMLADTGGNVGSQAATVVIRALALKQITIADWWKVIWKESQTSILLALSLGILSFLKVSFLSFEADIPAAFSLFSVAFIVALALSIQVTTATLVGATLPLLVKRLGGDPAVVASPAITTIVDITGLLIYFGIATMYFDL